MKNIGHWSCLPVGLSGAGAAGRQGSWWGAGAWSPTGLCGALVWRHPGACCAPRHLPRPSPGMVHTLGLLSLLCCPENNLASESQGRFFDLATTDPSFMNQRQLKSQEAEAKKLRREKRSVYEGLSRIIFGQALAAAIPQQCRRNTAAMPPQYCFYPVSLRNQVPGFQICCRWH